MASFKRKRSRKPWDIETLQLRMQDCLSALEPAILGEEGEDYDKEDIQFKAKIAHAYSQVGAKVRQAIKVKKLEELEEEIEELKKHIDQ